MSPGNCCPEFHVVGERDLRRGARVPDVSLFLPHRALPPIWSSPPAPMHLARDQTPLWAQRASARPSRLAATLPYALAFAVLFNVGILSTFSLLVLLLPLAYIAPTRLAYLRWGKGTFGRLLVLVLRLLSPTEVVLSAGQGVERDWVERDDEGKASKLKLPPKVVWVSNHTTLADWLYLWSFAYLSGHSSALYIALKASLRRIPIIGWACHLFGFAFLERKWDQDRAPFAAQLGRIAEETNRGGEEERMAFLLFPEGTIVTENTRGVSKRFADKSGGEARLSCVLEPWQSTDPSTPLRPVTDFKHLLLPRSTGLFFALRKLARTIPTLHLLDTTVGYPLPRPSPPSGAEPAPPQYASEFYTLPSLLLQGIPPPELHLHVRAFALRDIPLGDLSCGSEGDEDGTPGERQAFERWLRDRWAEKDALLERFRTEGSFVASGGNDDDDDDDDDDERRPGEVSWPVNLRHPLWEAPAAFAFFLPFVALFALWHWRRALLTLALASLGRRLGTQGGEHGWEDPIVGRDCPCAGRGLEAPAPALTPGAVDKLAGEL
ncbi:acyltransferase-domain-containing protein [Rhodotorula diobovata]|uniref:Acyltransferase-domain-containing protein n=1 Tax=Rhodotorula diobovata TaxID=5288 RepID=A0A5C5G3X9_9BASI|nr:acyltransferase-domain-containing protein [Rhodotorula diobovata]